MSQFLPLYKMIILTMLRRGTEKMTRAQVMEFVLGAGYTDYMTFQETLSALTGQGLVGEESAGARTFLHLTKDGLDTIDAMGGELRADIIQQIDEYLTKNRLSIREDAALLADYKRLANGTCEVRMEAKENGQLLYALTMNAPTEEAALAMCDRWKKLSGEIYRMLFTHLTGGAGAS